MRIDSQATALSPDVRSPLDFARLCDGIVVLPVDDGIVLAGGPARQLLSGAAVSAVLERLLPLLDGRHSATEIAEELEITAGQARQALALLDRAGVLERRTDGAPVPPPTHDHVATFLSRNITTTRKYRNSIETRAALASSSVLVVGAEPIVDAVVADLRDTGVGQNVVRRDPGDVTDADLLSLAEAPRGMVAVLDEPGLELEPLARRCRGYELPMLRFARSAGQLEIGPLFWSDYTACYRCFVSGYRLLDRSDGASRTDEPEQLLAALATAEILATMVHLTTPNCYRAMVTVSTTDLARQSLSVTPAPGCPDCDPAAAVGNEAASRASTYEWLIERKPAALRSPRTILDDQTGEDRQPHQPDLVTSPRWRLPDPGRPGEVSGLLRRLPRPRGVHDEYAVDVYVLSEEGRFGEVPGTVHKYDAAEHQLVSVRSDAPPVRRCLAGTDLGTADPVATLVLVGAPGKLFATQRISAYRLAHLAAGSALAELAAAAPAHGFTVTSAETWDQQLVDLLELRGQYEVIAAVVGVHSRKDVPCP